MSKEGREVINMMIEAYKTVKIEAHQRRRYSVEMLSKKLMWMALGIVAPAPSQTSSMLPHVIIKSSELLRHGHGVYCS